MTNYSTYINWRRQFHRFPELSDQEYKATKTLKQILKSYLDLPLNTGLVAEIGDGEDMVAVRTDIDAFPIEEQVHHEFTSTNQGVMHVAMIFI